MTQLFVASTFYQAVSIAAGIDSGAYGDQRRVLLTANNAVTIEQTPDIDEMVGAASVLTRFDSVVSWNDLIEPLHPKDFTVTTTQAPMFERLLRGALDLAAEEPIELVLESMPWPPSGTIAQIFADAPISIHSDGLMSYGPTRTRIPAPLGQRIHTLHHVELVEGLEPQLMREIGVTLSPHPPESLRKAFAEVAVACADEVSAAGLPGGPDTALVLGQYLANLGLITAEEEIELHRGMVRACARRGARRVIFKPHPAAGVQAVSALAETAAELGLEFVDTNLPVSAEVLFELLAPGLVVSCFSTALATADQSYGIAVEAIGTGMLLERLAPYENSNRIPLVLVDRLYAADAPDVDLIALADAAGYCMQPDRLPELRESTAELVADLPVEVVGRYFRRRRLSALGLPGGMPARTPDPARRFVRGGRRVLGSRWRQLTRLRDRLRERGHLL